MSEERLQALEERIEKALTSGGAQVTVQDPRVSSIQRWMWTVFGTIFTGVGLWLVSSVNTLNLNVERLIVQMSSQLQQYEQRFQTYQSTLEDHNERLKDLERRRGP